VINWPLALALSYLLGRFYILSVPLDGATFNNFC
jgi:hypothetical protein